MESSNTSLEITVTNGLTCYTFEAFIHISLTFEHINFHMNFFVVDEILEDLFKGRQNDARTD